jgi:hypothetical protein
VENLAGSDLHDDENVEGPEGGCDHHEEVASYHDRGMIAHEGQPTLFRVGRVHRTLSTEVLATVRGETRMVSFRCNSSAMRSPPQAGFSAAISSMSLHRSLGMRGLPTGRDPAPEETASLAAPAEEGIGLDEAMHMIRKGQIRRLGKEDAPGRRQFIHNLFGIEA